MRTPRSPSKTLVTSIGGLIAHPLVARPSSVGAGLRAAGLAGMDERLQADDRYRHGASALARHSLMVVAEAP